MALHHLPDAADRRETAEPLGWKNDGVIHYPIEWDAIFLLDNIERKPVEGEIYLSAPTLIY